MFVRCGVGWVETYSRKGARRYPSRPSKGFEPSGLKLKACVPAKVTFVRKTDETCAKEVVIKEYKIERKLPLNKPVTVEFTPRKGEFTFACGMDMIKGKMIVE